MAVLHLSQSATPQPVARGCKLLDFNLRDHLETDKSIGDGSFGSVVSARVHTSSAHLPQQGSVIAVKTMRKVFSSLHECKKIREITFLQTIPNHAHLVHTYVSFLDSTSRNLHVCMERMEGNLYQLMKSRERKCLDSMNVKSILYQIVLGLEFIHSHHYFHRDIKPENILFVTNRPDSTSFRRYSGLINSSSPSYVIKLADFGLAREVYTVEPYTTYVSTRWYRAPEVLLRAGKYSAPVDMWAVGAMAVEVATLKPLFPGSNEFDQVCRVCDIMGSPGEWWDKDHKPIGGGKWDDGVRLAGKLGFSFPARAPNNIRDILPEPQWPASLSNFVTACLLWDPAKRPTSAQALAHEYFVDAVDPMRPKSSASRILGRKQSDLVSSSGASQEKVPPLQTKHSWFRISLIGRSYNSTESSRDSHRQSLAAAPSPAPPPAHANAVNGGNVASGNPGTVTNKAGKRATWANGPSMVAPMPILPTIRPISPLSDAVTAKGTTGSTGDRKKQTQKSGHRDAELHRLQTEQALTGGSGLTSPQSAQKEGFFSHLRKRARRFSGRNQISAAGSPQIDDLEAQAGCAPWAAGSNRSSMVLDASPSAVPRDDVSEILNKGSQQYAHYAQKQQQTQQQQQQQQQPAQSSMPSPQQVSFPPSFSSAYFASTQQGSMNSVHAASTRTQQPQTYLHQHQYVPAQLPPQQQHVPIAQLSPAPAAHQKANFANTSRLPQNLAPTSTTTTTTNSLKRHHSLPKQHSPNMADMGITSFPSQRVATHGVRGRRPVVHGVQHYEAPNENEELLDEVLQNTQHVMAMLDREEKPVLRVASTNLGVSNPYPTPSPSASGSGAMCMDSPPSRISGIMTPGSMTPKPLEAITGNHVRPAANAAQFAQHYPPNHHASMHKGAPNGQDIENGAFSWPTPPYDDTEWAASASASIWAASSRI